MKTNKKILPIILILSLSSCKSFNLGAIDNPLSPDQVKKNTERLRAATPEPTAYNPYSTGIDENNTGSVTTTPNNLNTKSVKTVEIKILDPKNKDNPSWYSPAIEESGYKKKIVALQGSMISEVTASVTLSDNTRSANVKWSSSDNSIVNINSDSGLISIGQRIGKVTVSAISVIDPSKKDLIEIEVVDKSNFTLNELAKVNSIYASVVNLNGGDLSNRWKADNNTSVRAERGSQFQVTATVTLQDGTKNSRVLWESSDENVVKVSETGVVSPVGIGTASVIARYRLNPLKMAIIDVNVINSIPDEQFMDYKPVATPYPTPYPQSTPEPTPLPTSTPTVNPEPTSTPKPVINNALILVNSDNATMPSFFITKYEITQKEWKSVISANPSSQVDDSLPVSNVSWLNAIKYCNARSTKEGLPVAYNNNGELLDSTGVVTTDLSTVKGYRLPTVEEWEFAAKGGMNSFNFTYSGNNDYSKVAWSINDSGNEIKYPGQKEPNELGIYDMSGNIYEWTHSSISTDDLTKKIIKGGSYVTVETDLNARNIAIETNITSSPTYGNLGFRIVRTK